MLLVSTDQYTYFAFISYKREDERWAKWLQRKLEHYHLPSVIRGDGLPKKLRPIFRDKTDLGTGVLKESLAEGLVQSKYLIVICSPNSARSRWVGQEIDVFVSHGRERQIIPFVVDGTLDFADDDCCLNPAFGNIADELLCIDVREVGKEKAFVRVVSGLLDVSFDELWQRHRRYKIRRNIAVATLLLAVVACGLLLLKKSMPFETTVTLKEMPLKNTALPLPEKGTLVLAYGQKTDTAIVAKIDDALLFSEIPGKYRGKQARVIFSMFGFKPIDTVCLLDDCVELPVMRDSTYSTLRGTVENNQGAPQSEVLLEVLGYKAVTDRSGRFELRIPLKDQKPEYRIAIRLSNGVEVVQTVYPLSECLLIVD